MCKRNLESRALSGMPLRLLEVGAVGTPVAYIRVTKPEMENYAAASFVWGNEDLAIHATKTSRENLHERLEHGIRLSTLPQTLWDLIKVTGKLGLKYIWIDALCTVQDDEDECRREVGRMEMIYQRFEALISAAMAENSSQGFLQARNLNQAYGAVYEIPYWQEIDREKRNFVFLCEEPLVNLDEPVHRRVWTNQEHLVPLRTLIFGSKQVSRDCEETHAVDGGSESMENRPSYFERGKPEASTVPDLESHALDGMFRDWMAEVEKYSTRGRSRPSYLLPAFEANMHKFSAGTRLPVSEYHYGIWNLTLLASYYGPNPNHIIEKNDLHLHGPGQRSQDR